MTTATMVYHETTERETSGRIRRRSRRRRPGRRDPRRPGAATFWSGAGAGCFNLGIRTSWADSQKHMKRSLSRIPGGDLVKAAADAGQTWQQPSPARGRKSKRQNGDLMTWGGSILRSLG